MVFLELLLRSMKGVCGATKGPPPAVRAGVQDWRRLAVEQPPVFYARGGASSAAMKSAVRFMAWFSAQSACKVRRERGEIDQVHQAIAVHIATLEGHLVAARSGSVPPEAVCETGEVHEVNVSVANHRFSKRSSIRFSTLLQNSTARNFSASVLP